MWAILDMWQNVDILAAILDFETLMSFMYGFEKYISELGQNIHGIYFNLIAVPKCWGIKYYN